ncbi:BMP family ABC transporter substrate-binding protein [Nocardioides carbamazepini]|jgi:basic membrane protein A|uniref:BMP family ABC transporter substrate-binding protein n=1 Tax=Nocardioides carbamazepini TaxID=2854259 RepID=UPI00214A6018|nr:BMP family ABC transporter substrate-binding protein [Nocardioides carbamazepini]MCR1784627.1 BMP family ABC transporter substrate-binding protein [Nocardioides carbamazepini]
MRIQKFSAACVAVAMLALAGCGSSDEPKKEKGFDGPDPFAVARGAAIGEPGTATAPQWAGEGSVPKGQPDQNGDGKVSIGVITSGDTNDGTYYQSTADAVAYAADKNDWEYTVQGLVPLTQAVTAAENLCRQRVDLIVISDAQLAQAVTAASNPLCKDTFFYLQGGYGSPEQDETFTQSYDVGLDYAYVAGIAMGAYMKANDIKKTGFLSGIAAPFNTTIGKVFTEGVKAQVPDAEVVETYTGDQIDVGKAVEGFNAQASQGIGAVYPYFGAPTIAVAKKAKEAGIPVLGSPKTFCDSGDADFIGEVIFAPGYYLAPMLDLFAEGKLELGVTRNWRLGVDPVPAVHACDTAGDGKDAMSQAIEQAQADINAGKIDLFGMAGAS